MKKILFAATLLLGIALGAQATKYNYYIAQLDGTTMYFRGTNTLPTDNSRYWEVSNTGDISAWQDLRETLLPTISKVVFEPSFAEARPTCTAWWFGNFSNLTTIIGMREYLNTSEVTKMMSMFNGCSSLATLDLTAFNTEKVNYMQNMFLDCSNLKTIAVGDGWTTSQAAGSDNNFDMFKNCTSLVGQDGTTYDSQNVNRLKAHYNAGGYLTGEARWWSTREADAFSDAVGTTITIHCMGELKLLAKNVNAGTNYNGYTFLLARDMALDPTIENNFTAIGNSESSSFAGTFDGQKHTLSDINISASGRQAIFGVVSGATIRNLTLASSTITCTSLSSAAAIVSRIHNGSNTIQNCHVASTVSITSKGNAAGIVGSINTGTVTIDRCTSAATITNTTSGYSTGGILGTFGQHNHIAADATTVNISHCLYHGSSISAEGYLGAIVGSYTDNTNGYSVIHLTRNYYTPPTASIKAIGRRIHVNGESSTTTSDFDLGNYGAVCARVVTTEADIEEMGNVENANNNSVTAYDYGMAYDGRYYSHILTLDASLQSEGTALSSLINQYAGQTFDVKLLNRHLYKDGKWNTVCLPFNLSDFTGTIFSSAEQCEIRQLDLGRYQIKPKEGDAYGDFHTGVQDGKLYLFFKKISKTTAGTPYIVKWPKANGYDEYALTHPEAYDHLSPVFHDVTLVAPISGDDNMLAITSGDGKLTFQGTYDPYTRDYEDHSLLFLGGSNTLYHPNGAGDLTIGPFRAYFQLHGVQMTTDSGGSGSDDDDYIAEGGGGARAIVGSILDNDAAGITPLTPSSPHTSVPRDLDETWYTLDGRLLDSQPTTPGIYIHSSSGNKRRKVSL